MTNPQDPYGYNPFTYDPLGRVPPAEPAMTPPPVCTPPPAPPPRPPVNTLATLSLVFAFVFAPAGAILGHLGLAQIRRTGELGRDRAMAGLALSYVVITLTVVALTGWATLAASTSRRVATPATTTTTTSPAATVAPEAIAALLPGADALKNITADQNLEAGPTWDHPDTSFKEGTIDRTECWGSVTPGAPDVYSVDQLSGYRAAEFSDTRSFLKSTQVIEAVAAFRDPATAQSQLAKLQSGWRQCGGTTVTVTMPGGRPVVFAVGAPADAGNGVSTLDLTPKGVQVRSARAIAARANVVIDLSVSCSGTTDGERPRLAAVSIAKYILGKIPA